MFKPPLSRLINISLEHLSAEDEVKTDKRSRGELIEDRDVRFFEDIATEGATIPISFLQKDLEKITLDNGYLLPDYIRGMMDIGESFILHFDHVEQDVEYHVVVNAYKMQNEEGRVPCMIYIRELHIHKYPV